MRGRNDPYLFQPLVGIHHCLFIITIIFSLYKAERLPVGMLPQSELSFGTTSVCLNEEASESVQNCSSSRLFTADTMDQHGYALQMLLFSCSVPCTALFSGTAFDLFDLRKAEGVNNEDIAPASNAVQPCLILMLCSR
ncbi:hypothetical protein GOODEAATRI_027131 [Goodea atripinnis]|uniref:Uncharacterized protein n=1 Tax=Goodea atripinnis TaxID=208336 RepID=A0ABV0P851_9TELE